jgi:hypothetical protein
VIDRLQAGADYRRMLTRIHRGAEMKTDQ